MNAENQSPIRIAADGTWYFNDSEMFRLEAVSFLASRLHRSDGGYAITLGPQTLPILVEDVPFVIKSVSTTENGWEAVLADGRTVTLPPGEVQLVGDTPYFSLFSEWDSKFSRAAFWHITAFLVEREGRQFLDEPASAAG